MNVVFFLSRTNWRVKSVLKKRRHLIREIIDPINAKNTGNVIIKTSTLLLSGISVILSSITVIINSITVIINSDLVINVVIIVEIVHSSQMPGSRDRKRRLKERQKVGEVR